MFIDNNEPAPGLDEFGLLENLPDGFCVLGPDWRFVSLNAAAERILGHSRAELIGRDHWETYPFALGTDIERAYRRVMQDRVPEVFEMAFADRWFRFHVYPLAGQRIGIHFQETTDRYRAEERLRLAVETAGLGLWDYDITTDKVFWDARTRELYGAGPDEALCGFADVERRLHPADRARVVAARRAALDPASGGRFVVEHRTVAGDYWVVSRGRVLFAPDGRPVRVIGIVVDVTDQKQAADAARRNEERWRLAAETTGVGSWEHDLRTGARTWSPQIAEQLGIPPGQAPTMELIRDLMVPEDREAAMARYHAAFGPASDGEYVNQFRIRRPSDGAERWISLRGRIFLDSAGQPSRAVGIFLDITDQKRRELALYAANETLEARVAERTAALEAANQALSTERTRLGAVLDQLPYGVLLAAGPEGGIVYQNEVARGLMGRDVSKIGRIAEYGTMGALREDGTPLPPEEYALARALRDGTITRVRRTFARKDRPRIFEVFTGPVRDPDGGIVLAIAAFEDVTVQVEAEEALRHAQRMEAVGQLTGGVAHDFNNLLTAIIGNLEMLDRRIADERGRRMLEAAMRAADRGARLTGQLLAFARRQRLEARPLDVNAVTGGMVSLLAATLGGTVRLETAFSPDLWTAMADPTQLELMLLNVAINARDAMPEGGRLHIATANVVTAPPQHAEDPPAGEHVAITLTDTGMGMTPEVCARAFEPFFTTKSIGQGTGLGLPQVLGVAQQLGGGVRIVTAPGAGTAITVFLPRAAPGLPPAAPAPATDGASIADLSVLLVDDDVDVRQATAAVLRDAGAAVTEAAGGREALAAIAAGTAFDVALLDYAMPEMTGAETARRMLEARPGLRIVLLTGYTEAPDADLAGVRRILHKPFRAADLQRALIEVTAEPGEAPGDLVC